ncbi:hypothetical protein [Aquimarina agarilytica]|uniref:hypothetical protein n=1 Tax=Aquimarina agarilytica TaxID=1087449 RepID=UPI000287CD57|nr:hypothetical protein [Aquimarina agarilytica]
MKSVLFVLFFSLGMAAFSANTVIDNDFSLELKKDILVNKNLQKTKKSDKGDIAYNSYYAFEWLYKDSPFIKKLIVLA